MKSKLKELDVDFIGGQASLTKEEETVISNFIKSRNSKSKSQEPRKVRNRTVKEKQLA